MKTPTTAAALPGIHPSHAIEKIYGSFSTDTDGKLHTVVWISHSDRESPVNISLRYGLLLLDSLPASKAFFLGVLKSLEDSTHSPLLANLF
jgi:hypothetical protein